MIADDETPDLRTGASSAGHDAVRHYEIRVQGRLATHWSTWFDGLVVEADAGGTTVIRGPVVDQAALHGLLQKLRDVGIPLLSLAEITARRTTELTAHTNQKEN